MAFTDAFKGLPMSELIGAPLLAANTAQFNLADTMVTYVKKLAYEGGDETNPVNVLPMTVQRPVINQESSNLTIENVTVKPPLLGLVPIPALLVDSVSIDFTMEVKTHAQTTATFDTSTDLKVGAPGAFKFLSTFELTGHVGTHRENTRSTDNSAKYNVRVEAHQQAHTEGMSKLMDLLASASEPIKIEAAP